MHMGALFALLLRVKKHSKERVASALEGLGSKVIIAAIMSIINVPGPVQCDKHGEGVMIIVSIAKHT